MFALKKKIVEAVEMACTLTHYTPWGQCQRIAALSARLDERWGTDVWRTTFHAEEAEDHADVTEQ